MPADFGAALAADPPSPSALRPDSLQSQVRRRPVDRVGQEGPDATTAGSRSQHDAASGTNATVRMVAPARRRRGHFGAADGPSVSPTGRRWPTVGAEHVTRGTDVTDGRVPPAAHAPMVTSSASPTSITVTCSVLTVRAPKCRLSPAPPVLRPKGDSCRRLLGVTAVRWAPWVCGVRRIGVAGVGDVRFSHAGATTFRACCADPWAPGLTGTRAPWWTFARSGVAGSAYATVAGTARASARSRSAGRLTAGTSTPRLR